MKEFKPIKKRENQRKSMHSKKQSALDNNDDCLLQQQKHVIFNSVYNLINLALTINRLRYSKKTIK